MVLKYMEMSSSDHIPIHENWCLSLNMLDFPMAILGLNNENMHSSHTFC